MNCPRELASGGSIRASTTAKAATPVARPVPNRGPMIPAAMVEKTEPIASANRARLRPWSVRPSFTLRAGSAAAQAPMPIPRVRNTMNVPPRSAQDAARVPPAISAVMACTSASVSAFRGPDACAAPPATSGAASATRAARCSRRPLRSKPSSRSSGASASTTRSATADKGATPNGAMVASLPFSRATRALSLCSSIWRLNSASSGSNAVKPVARLAAQAPRTQTSARRDVRSRNARGPMQPPTRPSTRPPRTMRSQWGRPTFRPRSAARW